MHARFTTRLISASRLVVAIIAVMAVTISTVGVPAATGRQSARAGTIGEKPSVPSRKSRAKPAEPDPEAKASRGLPKPRWPAAGTADVAVPAAQPSAARGQVPWARAGGMPVYVGPAPQPRKAKSAAAAPAPPGRVRVDVLGQGVSQRLGAAGLVVRVLRSDGGATAAPVSVTLDYSGFKTAFGGNFADRLHLYRLPACALTTPTVRSCGQRTPVQANNDVASGRIAATVKAGPQSGGEVYALVSTAAGTQTGSYKATDLKASGKWEAGQSSGAFTYSYPLKFPPAPYGKAPELTFSYNSQSVDGRTSGENNQASWAGMGWELQSGFIERKYKACANDADAGQDALKTWGDLCWDSPVKGKDDGAVYLISLNGYTSELIWDSVSKHYRMKDDQDWKIEHPTTGGQGADSEYWIITAPDGTKSYLGYGADPTKTANNATNSVWTVPVIGDDSGEPCYTTSTPASMQPCDQAYRWNLDRVVDPNGNESVFYYNAETNTYKRHQGGAIVRYNRGGYLTRIEYGLREDAAKDTPATNQVEFASNNRCVERNREPDPYTNQPAACPTVATGGATSYPDVPVDLVCDATCTKESPSFFIVRQLSQIVTKARRIDGGAGYDNVATYQMKYSFPGTGDTTSESLWLDYIRPVGHMGNGPDLKMPVTGFNGANLNNIAESGKPSVNMRRIVSIENELGGNSKVTYGLPDACNTALTDWSGDKNLKDCFRSFYKPEGATAGQWGIFNKYVVTQVTDVDRVGGQPDQTTTYEYGGGAGWHFDDDLNRPDNDESWSDWRGYKTVKAIKGTSPDKTQRTTTTTTFFRGLNNDRTNTGDTAAKRSEKLTDFDGNIVDPLCQTAVRHGTIESL